MSTLSRSLRPILKAGLAGVTLAALAGTAFAGDATQLLFPLDGSYSVVPFSANGAQGNGPANAADPLQRNDDDFAGPFNLGFNFNIYGQAFNQVFINNNGNLTFGNGDSGFTPFAFPAAGAPRVAPFFADVDTRNPNSGVVHYRQDASALIVTWDNVGYFNGQADKTNTFQVVISNGADPRIGIGNNVCFSYDNMSWTTGSASGGVNGFGGSAATVGVNAGNGRDFFTISRFDHPGVDFAGPAGISGVDSLDNQDFCFNVTGLVNQAPIAVNVPPGGVYTLDPTLGQILNTDLRFIGPELGDNVTITSITDSNGAQLDGLLLTNLVNPGNPAVTLLNWAPGLGLIGNVYNLRWDFVDSFGAANFQDIQIRIIPAPGAAAFLSLAGLAALRRRRA